MNIYTLPRLPKIIWNASSFLVRNFIVSRRLPVIYPVSVCDRYSVVPCTRELIPDVVRLSSTLIYAGKIDLTKKILLKYCGKKLCFVLIDTSNNEAIGYGLSYFNKRDILEHTVHQGYTGIAAGYRGHGLGTSFRRTILNHFAHGTDLYGTSSRVSLSNKASLMPNLKNGYTIKERYFDKYMNEERVYMVCDLNQYRGKKEDNK